MLEAAPVSAECLRLGLADEVRYSILPILIGDGIPFFEKLDRRGARADKKFEARAEHFGPDLCMGCAQEANDCLVGAIGCVFECQAGLPAGAQAREPRASRPDRHLLG